MIFFFSFEPRGTSAGETIKEEMGTSPSFRESTVPLTLQLPLFQPRHTGPSPAGVFWLHLPFNVLSTCRPSQCCGVGVSTICCLITAPRRSETWWRLQPGCRGTHRAQEPADTTAVMDPTMHPAKGCTYAGGSASSPLSSLGAGCIRGACKMES